jgi:hypothetical protein
MPKTTPISTLDEDADFPSIVAVSALSLNKERIFIQEWKSSNRSPTFHHTPASYPIALTCKTTILIEVLKKMQTWKIPMTTSVTIL